VGESAGLGEGEREGEGEEGGMSEQEAQSIIRSLYWEVGIQLPFTYIYEAVCVDRHFFMGMGVSLCIVRS
jgi:hypothetical protein